MKKWLAHKYVPAFASKIKKFSSARSDDLIGRDILQPQDFTLHDWKKIIWVALDLKQSLMVNGRKGLNLICNNHVTLLFMKPCGRNLLSCSLATQLLGAHLTHYADTDFEYQANVIDSGRALSGITDLIIVNGCNQAVLSKVAEGSSAPVIGLSTNMYSILKALAFLMTIQENYGYLKGLKLSWIGPPNSVCNTVFSIFPSFGINIKFCCICAHGTGQMTPVVYENAVLACNKGMAEIHQCSSAAEAVFRTHIVIAAPHPEEDNKITLSLLDEAEFDWIFLHPLPRTEIEVSNDVFNHKSNLTWGSSANHVYIAMALIVSTLTGYQPKISAPRFEKC